MLRPYWKLPRLFYPSLMYNKDFNKETKYSRNLILCDNNFYKNGFVKFYNGLKMLNLKSNTLFVGFKLVDLIETKIIGNKIILSKQKKDKAKKKKKGK